jgi:hypothetical protein
LLRRTHRGGQGFAEDSVNNASNPAAARSFAGQPQDGQRRRHEEAVHGVHGRQEEGRWLDEEDGIKHGGVMRDGMKKDDGVKKN